MAKVLDCTRHTLAFGVNDEQPMVLFRDLEATWYVPAVDLRDCGDKVRILSSRQSGSTSSSKRSQVAATPSEGDRSDRSIALFTRPNDDDEQDVPARQDPGVTAPEASAVRQDQTAGSGQNQGDGRQPGGRPTFLVDIQCKVHCLRRFPPWPHGCHNRASSGQSP